MAWKAVVRRSSALSLAFVAAGAGQAIVIRHDKEDQLYRDLAANAKYAAVGKLEYTRDGRDRIATGNYIGVGNGKKWIVTAAHVLNGDLTNTNFVIGGRTYEADLATKKLQPGFDAGFKDIGVVALKDPDNHLTITPAKYWHNTVAIPANLGDRLIGTAVGFGFTGTGNSGPVDLDEVKRAMQNRIDGLDVKYDTNKVLHGYLTDFDKNDAANNKLDKTDYPGGNFVGDQKSARAWLDLEGHTAHGDSGGGLFVELDGQTVMLGVASAMRRIDGGDQGEYGGYSEFMPFTREYANLVKGWTGIAPVPEPAALFALVAALSSLAGRRRVHIH